MSVAASATAALLVPMVAVYDDVLERPDAYRAWALQQSFGTIRTGDQRWHGIAPVEDGTMAHLITARQPGARTHLTFLRQSPEGQIEPTFIHSDEGMGQWTAILYLTPAPPEGDGTTFWRDRETGDVCGAVGRDMEDRSRWEPWRHVSARFNRLLLFDAPLFHSRGLEENYGTGSTARLIQVAFGNWGC